MKFRRILLALTLTGLLLAAAGCSDAPQVDWELKITGDVEKTITLSFKDLAGMEQMDLSEVLMEKSTGEDEVTSWSGVPLKAILEEAGAGQISTITSFAADGYAVEISADELENAVIALKDNGEWIADVSPDKGPIRLVVPETPANRWVFQLTEIQVNQ